MQAHRETQNINSKHSSCYFFLYALFIPVVFEIVISKLLRRRLKAKRRTPAYSRTLHLRVSRLSVCQSVSPLSRHMTYRPCDRRTFINSCISFCIITVYVELRQRHFVFPCNDHVLRNFFPPVLSYFVLR